MADATDFDSWASIIRSCCLTSKTPLTMYEISRDVKMLEGTDIPYKRFGYRSLEELVQNIPDMKVYNLGGKMVAQTRPSQETAHISLLVRLAKPAKKKSRSMAPTMAANRYNYNMGNRRPTYPRSEQNSGQNTNRYNTQNKYVPNRPTGHYSSQQSQTSSYNRSQQQQQNGDQYRRTSTTSPVSSQAVPPRQAPTAPTPKTQPPVRVAPTTPPTQPPPPKPIVAPTPTTVTPAQQRIAQAKVEPPPSQQQRLRVTDQAQKLIRSPQQVGSFAAASSTTPTVTQSSLQQRLVAPATPVLTQPASSNIQERLNVQRSRAPLQPVHDPRLVLNSYVQARNLPLPIYKNIDSKDKNIYSSVTVNSKKYSSYPNEAKTKDDAEKLAAQAALNELLNKNNIPQTITQNRADILKRVVDIVKSYPNGMFESRLVESYIAKHNEGLPQDWLKCVEHAIRVDVVQSNVIILNVQESSSGPQSRSPSPTIYEPPALNFGNVDEFWFKVYVVYNSMDVWGIIISDANSDKINDLAIEMKHFYDINEATPTAIVPGQHYAVLDSENWHRVRCIKVDDAAKTATVFFIDRGDEDVFNLSELHDLSVKFCNLPAQAIQISLEGLEPFYDCVEMQQLIEDALVEEELGVWVTVDSASKQADVPLVARCYIKKDETTIVDVNLELVKEFMNKVADPKNFMKTNKAVCEVYISEIRDKQIFVQVKSTGLKLLNDILTYLAKNCLDGKFLKPASRLEKSKLYLVKTDNGWVRIRIIEELNNTAQVECIDEGSIITVEKEILIAIEDFSNTLAMFPRQATQVNLHKISPIMFDEKMAAHLRSLAPKTDVFYMKVVGDRETIPRVELYKRTENNYLASLNDTLALEPEISSKTDDNNNDKTKSRLRNDRKSQAARAEFPLKTPKIPQIGEYFDVIITMAAHPGNFTVQPLQTSIDLKKLMMDLSAFCQKYNGPPLTSSNVKVGSMYAAKYETDGKWYRAYISKILGTNICAVYFCDYGDYRAVSLEQLQPLADQFYDLPYQAIKAKLHGITPKLKGDWTVKDSFRFNELVVDKPFVSIVKAYDVDNKGATSETVLSLELIDTTTEDDIYIIQQLVDEKRADRIVEEQYS